MDNYEEILKGNIDDLFIKYSNFNSEEKKEFKKEEESLLNKENENKIYKIKLLNLIFSKTIEEIFKMYLNDDKHIAYGETKLFLEEFKTFLDDFNEYISKQRQNIKKCINLLVGCKLQIYQKIILKKVKRIYKKLNQLKLIIIIQEDQ